MIGFSGMFLSFYDYSRLLDSFPQLDFTLNGGISSFQQMHDLLDQQSYWLLLLNFILDQFVKENYEE